MDESKELIREIVWYFGRGTLTWAYVGNWMERAKEVIGEKAFHEAFNRGTHNEDLHGKGEE